MSSEMIIDDSVPPLLDYFTAVDSPMSIDEVNQPPIPIVATDLESILADDSSLILTMFPNIRIESVKMTIQVTPKTWYF